jgi:hypothetical protein
MLLKLINIGIEFVKENAATVAILMAVMSYIKEATANFKWRKPWMLTVLAFVLGFAFAFPESGAIAEPLPFVFEGFFLGLTATGVYNALHT